jgi:hypothetical protein
VEHERWGTPVASYVAGLTPDARPLDRGKPRDEDTEGGNQPADKSLINRRLSFHSQPCAATTLFSPTANSPNGCSTAPSPLDREHKRLDGTTRLSRSFQNSLGHHERLAIFKTAGQRVAAVSSTGIWQKSLSINEGVTESFVRARAA